MEDGLPSIRYGIQLIGSPKRITLRTKRRPSQHQQRQDQLLLQLRKFKSEVAIFNAAKHQAGHSLTHSRRMSRVLTQILSSEVANFRLQNTVLPEIEAMRADFAKLQSDCQANQQELLCLGNAILQHRDQRRTLPRIQDVLVGKAQRLCNKLRLSLVSDVALFEDYYVLGKKDQNAVMALSQVDNVLLGRVLRVLVERDIGDIIRLFEDIFVKEDNRYRVWLFGLTGWKIVTVRVERNKQQRQIWPLLLEEAVSACRVHATVEGYFEALLGVKTRVYSSAAANLLSELTASLQNKELVLANGYKQLSVIKEVGVDQQNQLTLELMVGGKPVTRRLQDIDHEIRNLLSVRCRKGYFCFSKLFKKGACYFVSSKEDFTALLSIEERELQSTEGRCEFVLSKEVRTDSFYTAVFRTKVGKQFFKEIKLKAGAYRLQLRDNDRQYLLTVWSNQKLVCEQRKEQPKHILTEARV